jgi:hypothetical protein
VYSGLRALFNVDVFFVWDYEELHNGFIMLQLWIDYARVSFFVQKGALCFARGK